MTTSEAACRESVVAPASLAGGEAEGQHEAHRGQPVHSLRCSTLATITKNQVVPKTPSSQPFEVITRPTELQSTVLRLLGVRL